MCERFNIPDHVLHMSFNILLNKKRRMHAFIKDWDILFREYCIIRIIMNILIFNCHRGEPVSMD